MFWKLRCVLLQRPARSRSSAACEVLGVGVVSVPPPTPGAAEAQGRASRFGVETASQGGGGVDMWYSCVFCWRNERKREFEFNK